MSHSEASRSILVKGCSSDTSKAFWRVAASLHDMPSKRLIAVWISSAAVATDSLENTWAGSLCWMLLFLNFKIDPKVVFCILPFQLINVEFPIYLMRLSAWTSRWKSFGEIAIPTFPNIRHTSWKKSFWLRTSSVPMNQILISLSSCWVNSMSTFVSR